MSKPLTLETIQAKCKTDNLALIKNLNLWGASLGDVSIVEKMPNLEVLSLSVNKIDSLKYFRSLKKLQELFLRKNAIANQSELAYLKGLTSLRVLWLSENPIALTPNYRKNVLKILPNLSKLDDKIVTPDERKGKFEGDDSDCEPDNQPSEEADAKEESEEEEPRPQLKKPTVRQRREEPREEEEEDEPTPPPKNERNFRMRQPEPAPTPVSKPEPPVSKPTSMLKKPEEVRSLRPKPANYDTDETPQMSNKSFHESVKSAKYYDDNERKRSPSPPKPQDRQLRGQFKKDTRQENIAVSTPKQQPTMDRVKSSKVKNEEVLTAMLMLLGTLNEFETDLLREECEKHLNSLRND